MRPQSKAFRGACSHSFWISQPEFVASALLFEFVSSLTTHISAALIIRLNANNHACLGLDVWSVIEICEQRIAIKKSADKNKRAQKRWNRHEIPLSAT